MNREELKEQIKEELIEVERGALWQISIEKIMLLVDEYHEPTTFDFAVLLTEVMEESVALRIARERQGFTQEEIYKECEEFLSINYPKGGDVPQIRVHFNRYIRKRKPAGTSKEQDLNNFING